ncbi:MAG TPA: nucleotidyl transferase AbiEii/AbiGii toxin family protein [Anaerolineae bacterium]|nr:nucleotidyl transferase AbiEii/AbiGii toxin family protein [Anaerolineae bacterium]
MSVLTRLQREFLSRFFSRPSGQAFYLTGGVALSEFYLQHRLSQDLDLFTQSQPAFEASENDLATAAREVGAGVIRFHPPKPIDRLLSLAKQKDLGFSEYVLGSMLEQITRVEERDLPRMLKPVDLEDMTRTLMDLARRLKRFAPG